MFYIHVAGLEKLGKNRSKYFPWQFVMVFHLIPQDGLCVPVGTGFLPIVMQTVGAVLPHLVLSIRG